MDEQVEVSSDKSKLDVDVIVNYLAQSYWAKNISQSLVKQSIENSICFGAYINGRQIGFARMVSDCATFAYLADVFVLPDYQGKGVAKTMLNAILTDERFTNLRRIMLATRDAHTLYEKFGFESLSDVEQQKFMQIRPVKGYEASGNFKKT